MFKQIVFVLVFFLFLGGTQGCVVSNSGAKKVNLDKIVGNWSETWGAGQETNVNYSDVYVMSKSGDKLQMSCPKRNNYRFEEINFDGRKLAFKLIIKDLKYGSEDAWVRYDLDLQDNTSTFRGTALTKAGKEAKIIWTKLAL